MDLIRLETLEMFQVVEQFIQGCEERELDLSIEMKNVRSRTAKEMQTTLAKRMLAKYEAAITESYDLRNHFARSMGRAFEPPHLTDSPNALRRRITDCDRRIAALIEEAHLFALRFSWSLTGGFDPETKEYKFVVGKMSDVFQGRAA